MRGETSHAGIREEGYSIEREQQVPRPEAGKVGIWKNKEKARVAEVQKMKGRII